MWLSAGKEKGRRRGEKNQGNADDVKKRGEKGDGRNGDKVDLWLWDSKILILMFCISINWIFALFSCCSRILTWTRLVSRQYVHSKTRKIRVFISFSIFMKKNPYWTFLSCKKCKRRKKGELKKERSAWGSGRKKEKKRKSYLSHTTVGFACRRYRYSEKSFTGFIFFSLLRFSSV